MNKFQGFCLIFFTVIQINGTLIAQDDIFEIYPSWVSNSANITYGIAFGDIDRDGDLDIVCGNRGSNTVYYNENGQYSEWPAWTSMQGNDTRSVALGDIDGDGYLDLVCGNAGYNKIYLNVSGQFSDVACWTSEDSFITRDIALGDFDNNGYLDLVCANDENSNTVYYNYDGIVDSTATWRSGSNLRTFSVAVCDITGDGYLDILFGYMYNGHTVYENMVGNFSTNIYWSSPEYLYGTRIAVGDINGDGNLDLVCGNDEFGMAPEGGKNNNIYFNIGNTLDSFPGWVSIPAMRTMGIALGDVDKDGSLDLVCANYYQSNTLYISSQNNLLSSESWVSGPGNMGNCVALGDIDGDGDLDVVFGNSSNNTLYINNVAPFEKSPDWEIKLSTYDHVSSIAVGDVDLDGDLDLVCGCYYGYQVFEGKSNFLFKNQGGQLQAEPFWIAGTIDTTLSVALGDINGDGYQDLACGNKGEANVVYSNTGGSFPPLPDWISEPENDTYSIDYGDINGDGRIDLVCGNNGQRNTIYFNVFGSLSSTPGWFSADYSNTRAIALGDIDNDGDLDLVCGNYDQKNTIYINKKGILDTLPCWYSNSGHSTQSVVLGDINGDGYLDLVSGNYSQGLFIYLNNYGLFSENPDYSVGSGENIKSISLGDINGDGPIDLFCGNYFQKDNLFLNINRYIASVPIWSPSFSYGTECSQLADINGDGDLDVICGNRGLSTLYSSKQAPVYRGDPLNPANHLPNNGAFLRFVKVKKIDSVSSRIHFTAFDVESDPVWIVPEYQFEGEPVWYPVDIIGYSDGIGPFETFPAGVRDSIDWDTQLVRFDRRDVILRLRTVSVPSHVSIIQHIASYLIKVGKIEPRHPHIATFSNMLSFSTITLGDTASVDFMISNTGLVALSINDMEFPSQGMWIGQQLPINISPGMSNTLTIFYFPDESLEVSGNLVINSNDPLNPAIQIPLQAKARPIDYSLVNLYPTDEIEQDMALNVSLVMQDSTCSDSALVYFRRSGETDFKNIRMNKIPGPVNDQYNIAISSDSIGLSGVEYFVGVYNHLANRFGGLQRLRLRATNLAFPLVQPANKYSIISIPLEMQGTIGGLLSDDLGSRDVTQWRIFSYETDTISDIGSYVELPTESQYEFTQGRSYWLISKDSKYLDTGPLMGTTAPADSAFSLLLTPGWNMVGNPFNFPVSWESILVDTLTSGGVDTLTMEEAQSTAIGTSSPVAWVIGVGYQDTVGVLEPFDGYWVQNLLDTTIVLRILPVEAPGTGAGTLLLAEAELKSNTGWRIGIKASSCGAADLNNYAGVREGAVDHYDCYDYPEPPATPGKYLSVYFPHRDWNRYRGDYSSDIRGEYKSIEIPMFLQASCEEELRGNMWYLDVIKSFSILSGGDEVTLEFTGLEDVPVDFVIYLVDNRLERFVDLRKDNDYSFFLGKRGSVTKEENARFMLLVGSAEFIDSQEDQLPKLPGATALHQNYPNPFNPSTVIRYDIATPGHVELNIYDARGALVKVLVNRYREPGRYEVGWNGANERGAGVVSGIYFYRMMAGSYMETRKLVMMR